ncbi:MAG: UDP-N-acetylmuramoyl-L-alanyl-D-glutamate--2,6-diaminopimelate ligase [Actinobacteria bacterium]|nr:UDP-N-acetylmuramoyl-L-alanyl-D-glutamate--2,6-diaminopimelate ligase [Actinomycetota bacterium]
MLTPFPPTKDIAQLCQFLGYPVENLPGDSQVEISGVTHASTAVTDGDLFFALPGANVHGSIFSLDAKNRGARAILTDEVGAKMNSGLPTFVVTDPRKVAGMVSAWFYQEPFRSMYSVGVTGTNGKTTTTTLLQQLWSGAKRNVGLIGTVETRIGQTVRMSKRTTPESSDMQRLAFEMRSQGVTNFVMEVSSHALVLERVRGSHFSAVAFTNLTQDHLDFHRTMEDYFQAKAKLFSFEFADKAFINIDDPFGSRLANETELPVIRLSRSNSRADWYFQSVRNEPRGMEVSVVGVGGILIEGFLPLHGEFNLDNSLMAIAIAFESGIDPLEISRLLPSLTGAQGRLEAIDMGQDYLAFVDYAHTPDAVSRVLATCKEMTSGRVIAVLGCGGDRDASKRILMGTALLFGSHVAVFTSDNPRSEDPMSILESMTYELPIQDPSKIIVDRLDAIKYAVTLAQTGDLVIVLGKGHEVGQEINAQIFPFDDRKILAQAIETEA